MGAREIGTFRHPAKCRVTQPTSFLFFAKRLDEYVLDRTELIYLSSTKLDRY